MNFVLATALAMATGTVHNIQQPLPEAIPSFSASVSGPASYAYDEDHCRTRPSGAIVCHYRRR